MSLIGLDPQAEPIMQALTWLIEQQQSDGLWRVSYVQPRAKEKDTAQVRDMKLWISLVICSIFRRFEA